MTSVVIMSKNDNYGGNLHHRATHSLTCFLNNFDEVIYVDWKSPSHSLIDDIKDNLPKTGKLKVYEVKKTDIEIQNPEYVNYSIVECLGRNIGIRRATHEWVLVSNIDILLEKFDLSKYHKDTLYTAAKRHAPESLHLKYTDTNQLLCAIKNNYHHLKLDPDGGSPEAGDIWDPGDFWSLIVGCGDFQFAHKDVWQQMKGFEESAGGRSYADSNLMKKGYIYANIKKTHEDIFHLDHGNSKEAAPGETLPNNDMFKFVRDFKETQNTESWGWKGHDLKNYTV